MNESVIGVLHGLIRQHGFDSLMDSSRLRSFLNDECGAAKREINALIAGLEEHIPQDLRSFKGSEPMATFVDRLVRRLIEQRALAEEPARWAVSGWAQALEIRLPDEDSTTRPVPHLPAVGWMHQVRAGLQRLLQTDKRVRIAGAAVAAVIVYFFVAGSGGLNDLLAGAAIEITAFDAPTPYYDAQGKGRPFYVVFRKRDVSVTAIEMTLRDEGGQAQWDRRAWRWDVTAEENRTLRAATGEVRPARAAGAVNPTFDVVLVAADGQRSKPFRATLDVPPPPATPTPIPGFEISAIEVAPEPFRTDGADRAIYVSFRSGGTRIARIETTIDPSASELDWNPSCTTWATVSEDEHKAGRSLACKLKVNPGILTGPRRIRLKVVLVTADGRRSAPRTRDIMISPS